MAGLLSDVLPAVYSGADELKRRVKGLLGDPRKFMAERSQDLQTMQDQDTASMYGLLGAPSADPRMAQMVQSDPAWVAQQAEASNQRMLDMAMLGITGWHGSRKPIDAFDFSKSVDGGIHFGTRPQAEMRGAKGGSLIEADVDIKNPMRSRDTGGNWKDKIRNAKSKGHDGIVYLNRYEGMSLEDIQRAQEAGIDLDRLTDAQFRKFFPNAKDSFIAFTPEQIKILQNIKK